MTTATGATAQVLTEADLLKSIKDLETAATTTAKVEDPPQPRVAEVRLAKSTLESITTGASAGTRKALDVSDILTDVVGLLAKHNDEALSTLQKSINSSAERDLAFIRTMTDMKKSIDALAEKVEAYGETPARTPRSAATTDVLHKSGTNGNEIRLDPRTAKRAITQGLEVLAKSLQPSDPRFADVQHAAIKFETTGQIDDRYLVAAQKALAGPAV